MTFARKTYERKQSSVMALAERAALGLKPSIVARGVMAHCGDATPRIAKMDVCRSERYRRLVAAFPCIHCGIAGLSQCAHGNAGKGMGMKTDDRNSFPLCADSPGRQGCHSRFDQHALFTRAIAAEIEQAWAAHTRRRINAAGLWPAEVPQLETTPTKGQP